MAINKYYLQEDGETSIYSLDGLSNLETDLPDLDYKRVNLLSDGSFIDGIGFARGRELTGGFNFKNSKEEERESFLDTFTKDSRKTLWLYKEITKRLKNIQTVSGSTIINIPSTADTSLMSTGNIIKSGAFSTDTVVESIASTTIIASNAASVTFASEEMNFQTFLGRMRVYPMPTGGESYENINLSETLEVKLFSESPYFTSTSTKSATVVSTGSGEFETTSVNITGRRTPATYSFLSSGSTQWSFFQVKTADQFGFTVNTQITSSQTITVKTTGSSLEADIDNNTIENVFTDGSAPFYLERGDNTLQITATSGTLTVTYNERKL